MIKIRWGRLYGKRFIWVFVHNGEHKLFNVLVKTINPRFERMSGVTVSNDCLKIIGGDKKKIKEDVKFFGQVTIYL